ncbi:MAG: hypothetical protein AAFW60_03930, partial [Pseudomonadota bacterium]
EFDWAAIVTPSLELNATAAALRDALDNHSSPAAFADAMTTYLHSWPLWLDGRHGDDIADNPDLIAFQEAVGISPNAETTNTQFWNAGAASCERGCGSNPLDSYGIPDPHSYKSQLARGTVLANPLLRVSGGTEQAIADLYAIHSQYRLFQATGTADTECHPLPYEALYERLQDAFASGQPNQAISDADISSADDQNAMYVQLIAALQAQGALDDGWNYLPRLNVINRLMYANIDSIQGWNRVRRSIGFHGWDRSTATVFSNRQDRLMVLLSWAAQRNLVPYFRMWGYEIDHAEARQISDWGFPTIEPVFYAIPPTGHCTSLEYDELPVDGVSTWPQ